MTEWLYSMEKVNEVIKNNCGDPPTKALLEHHISINEWKLDMENKRTHCKFLSLEEQNDLKETFRRLIERGYELLKTAKVNE